MDIEKEKKDAISEFNSKPQSIKLILSWNEVKTRVLTLLSSGQIPPRFPDSMNI